jgi:hypothetical protein
MSLQQHGEDNNSTTPVVNDLPFNLEVLQHGITVSIAVASFEDLSPEKFIKCAEIAPSTGVKKGSNTVEEFGDRE